MANGPSADMAASKRARPRVFGRFSAMGESAVLDGLGNMRGADGGAVGQIGDRAGDFEGSVPGAGREAEWGGRLLQQLAGAGFGIALPVEFGAFEPRVGDRLAGSLARLR